MLLLQLLLFFVVFLWFWGLSDPLRVIESSGGWPLGLLWPLWLTVAFEFWILHHLRVGLNWWSRFNVQALPNCNGHRLPGSYWLKYPRCRLTPNVARGQAMPCNLSKLAAILRLLYPPAPSPCCKRKCEQKVRPELNWLFNAILPAQPKRSAPEFIVPHRYRRRGFWLWKCLRCCNLYFQTDRISNSNTLYRVKGVEL